MSEAVTLYFMVRRDAIDGLSPHNNALQRTTGARILRGSGSASGGARVAAERER
jgi:hypothetical protein